MAGKLIGIDLGTTNSCACVMESGERRVIPNREGSRTTPSVVAFTDKGDVLVGHIAKRQAVTNPQRTLFAVKRLIGQKFDAPRVQEAMGRLPFPVVKAPNGDAWLRRGRPRLRAPRDLGHRAALPQAERRSLPARGDRGRGHHRPRLLRRCPAAGHQGRRAHRGPQRGPHHQRAHGRRAGLRPRQEGPPGDPGHLRLRRRHLRLHPDGDERRSLRGAGHQRRHLPGRRGLRSDDPAVAGGEVPRQHRPGPDQGPHGPAAAQGGLREGQVRAVHPGSRGDPAALHRPGPHGPSASGGHPHPRGAGGHGPPPGGTHHAAHPGRPARKPGSRPRTWTRSSSWAARPACPWCSSS